jgi:hypothetical protein
MLVQSIHQLITQFVRARAPLGESVRQSLFRGLLAAAREFFEHPGDLDRRASMLTHSLRVDDWAALVTDDSEWHAVGDAIVRPRYVRRRDAEDGMVKIEAMLHSEEAEPVWTMLNHTATQLAGEPDACSEEWRNLHQRVRNTDVRGEANEPRRGGATCMAEQGLPLRATPFVCEPRSTRLGGRPGTLPTLLGQPPETPVCSAYPKKRG